MVLGPTPSEAQFLLHIAEIEFGVVHFTTREEISSPYEVDLTIASKDEIDFDDVIGKPALLTILGDERDRYIHGIINEFTQSGATGDFHLYQASMVPSLWLLSLEQDCRIFQKKSVQDIVKQVLQDAGITAEKFDFRLQNQYQPREYCVQYRETDLNFISRLLEEEGIFYFFEHSQNNHVLVFGDSTVNYKPIEGKPNDQNQVEVPFHYPDALVPEKEFVSSMILSRQIRSGKVTLRDFNFEKPSLDLTSQKQADSHQKLEMYDYPGEYLDVDRGKKLADVRLQEAIAFKDKAEGQSICPRFIPGFTFKLTDHETEGFDQEYLIVEIVHTGSQPQTLEERAGGGESSYSNQFFAIPSSVTYRPERNTPKPVVEGVQTAIVVGPAGEEIYTDPHGRVKVQFHWDREGKRNENSSCWIRVSQLWAGAGWGAMFIPRIEQEVIVDFIEGDPDRPIITGRVYHGTNTPPYTLPDEKTKSTIMSRTSPRGETSNELLMEDQNGKTQVVLSNAYGHKITEDEESQTLTIETRDQNLVRFDDKNKNITILTTNNHQMIYDDENKKITLTSTDGYTIEMDDENEKMLARTKNGHIMVYDDKNEKVEIVTTQGHTAVFDDQNEKISLTSKKGHYMTIDDSGDSITLEDSGGAHRFKIDIGGSKLIIATDSGSIDVEAPSGTLSLKAVDIVVDAAKDLTLKGAMNLSQEAGMQHTTKGTMVNAEASGIHTIKGSLVQIN